MFYTATIKGFIGGSEVELENKSITCNTSSNKWSLSYTGFADKIRVYFEEKETLRNYISNLDLTSNGLEIDPTPDQNLRYVGATPKNYINFNGETWRIIGLFDVYNVDSGQTEKLVKIIRNDSLGRYSWDSSAETINYGYGINEWSQADLMYELNCDGSSNSPYCRDDITDGYLSNLTSGTATWFYASRNTRTATYDYSNNIKSSWVDKIAKVRWNLGSYTNNTTAQLTSSALNMYNAERSTAHISNPADGVTRTNTWDGKIALMYPSDYGYASTNITCRDNIGLSDSNSIGYCKNDNWLFYSSFHQFTLSPSSGDAYYVFAQDLAGYVDYSVASLYNHVRPAIFLKSNVVISGGTGENIENAYTIG